MSLASDERSAICDEFERAGPDRPTLCAGWTTRDLLAHLLIRERKPWLLPAIAVPALSGVADQAMRGYAGTPWLDMVGQLRGGAPVWSPFAIAALDRLGNGAELYVHLEDVRRGEPGWEPRPADPARDEELWAVLKRMGRMFYRSAPPGVVLRRPSGEQHVVTTGSGVVTLTGEPGELLLQAFGRDTVRVQIDGTPADVAAFTAAPRGM